MRTGTMILAMGLLLTAPGADAFDAAGTDIIGLRLGMADTEVIAALRQQGFAVTRDHGALLARTRDGQLRVEIDADRTAREVRYTFTGHGAGEQEKIGASVIDRFGEPDQRQPMAWCLGGQDGTCPANVASLTYLPESLTLVLRAGIPQEP